MQYNAFSQVPRFALNRIQGEALCLHSGRQSFFRKSRSFFDELWEPLKHHRNAKLVEAIYKERSFFWRLFVNF
jgi:hypothetical protein